MADGVILDLGPGDGRQMAYYTNPSIQAIYGPEPCKELHSGLNAMVSKIGMNEKYHILDCGAERSSLIPRLGEAGLLEEKKEGIFDTIISSKVLCSVPDLEDTVANLYSLLKPGGKLIICEHIRNKWGSRKGSLLARGIQEFFMLQGWTFFLGGCHLTRKTDEVVKEVARKDGGWKSVDLEYVVQWGAIPFVLGVLVKMD
jgi:SAM-dependent methyltransferase